MVSSIQWSIFAGVVVMVSSLITLFSLSASSSLASNVVDKPGTLDSQGGICQTTVPNFTGGQSEATSCRPRLKIYVYDLPRKFNFGLFPKSDFKSPENELPWNSSEIPEWPGGNRTAKHQHSVAYYLYTDLLLKDNNSPSGSMAIRVKNPEDADVFFVPFFASLSFNRFGKFRLGKINQVDRALQKELVSFLNASEWWQRSGGRDHIVPMTHPNSMRFVRHHLHNCIFVVVDFGRYDWYTARLLKDVVSPYNHLIPKFEGEEEKDISERRKTLLFFRGTVKLKQVKRFRTRLYGVLVNESGIEMARSPPKSTGFSSTTEGMRTSKFCLHISGDTASSCRLFDSIMSRCVPVIVSDLLDLPFEGFLNYSQFSIFVPEKDAITPGVLANRLRNISKEEWLKMWRKLGEVQHHFEFNKPAIAGDAIDLIWDQIYKKLPNIKLFRLRKERLFLPEWWDFPKRARRTGASANESDYEEGN